MALVNCPSCGNEVSKKAVSCPKCGHPFKEVETAKGVGGCGLFFIIVGAIVVAAIVIGLGL